MGNVLAGLFLLSLLFLQFAAPDDSTALLAIKKTVDPGNNLPWSGRNFCRWPGVKECSKGRVTKLVVEFLSLNGTLDSTGFNSLDQLRVLSLKGNGIAGALPEFSSLGNLKILYLNVNSFSGGIPDSLAALHRLRVLVLSGNRLSGALPASLAGVPRLTVLLLDGNVFSGEIPPLNQTDLKVFNASNNRFQGEIPATRALLQFNGSVFSGNTGLCGEQIQKPCAAAPAVPPSVPAIQPSIVIPPKTNSQSKNWFTRPRIIAISAAGGVALILLVILLAFLGRKRNSQSSTDRSIGVAAAGKKEGPESGEIGVMESREIGGARDKSKSKGFAWDEEGIGTLVFCGGIEGMYGLDDLLKASAEILGRGTVGSTYKAVMESGYIVTVKRLKNSRSPGPEEFERVVEALGRLKHANLVPLRAYFQAKEERLLVYDYYPNGSLFSLIHGTRPAGGKPLHWTSCLKIAEDLATALVYLHQVPGIVHGNLKSSNVLLGPDFESCLTDYGLTPFQPEPLEEGSSLFYKAPECRGPGKLFTTKSDVYSFGVLLLELLTGKTPFQDMVQNQGVDIPNWVRSVREVEMESLVAGGGGGASEDPQSGAEGSEEKLVVLLNIAMACVGPVAENRPAMRDVLKMINEARSDPHASSNGSDHSPGRWSDTVQSLPREYGSEHLTFAERD